MSAFFVYVEMLMAVGLLKGLQRAVAPQVRENQRAMKARASAKSSE
jgi:uncharacterized membrane protein YGL010W